MKNYIKSNSRILKNTKSVVQFSSGTKTLVSILGVKKFEHPKPIDLIKHLVSHYFKKDITVLDFFAGSGTTGHAVMQLNREDGGKRKFILVTNNENEIGTKITYERLYRIIKGKTTVGSDNFSWCKTNEPFSNTSLRVFNIKHYDVEVNQIDALNSIKNSAKESLKALNPSYDPSDLDILLWS